MAIASYIQPTGALCIGAAEPEGNSLNSLRNYRDPAIQIEQTTGIQELATWFTTYVQNSTISSKPYRFAQFREGVVFRIRIDSINNQSCNAPYYNVSNGSFAVRIFGGGGPSGGGGTGTGFQVINVSGLTGGTVAEGQLYSQSGLGGGGVATRTYQFLVRDLETLMQTNVFTVTMRCDSNCDITYDGVVYNVGSSIWSRGN
jgi:hypothetical protein